MGWTPDGGFETPVWYSYGMVLDWEEGREKKGTIVPLANIVVLSREDVTRTQAQESVTVEPQARRLPKAG